MGTELLGTLQPADEMNSVRQRRRTTHTILPSACDLGGSSTGAWGARPPPFPPPGRAMPSQQRAQAVRTGSPSAVPACPASPPSHSSPWHEAAGRAEALQDADTQSQGASPNSAALSHPIPLGARRICSLCPPAAPHEPVQVTVRAEHQPRWKKRPFQLG